MKTEFLNFLRENEAYEKFKHNYLFGLSSKKVVYEYIIDDYCVVTDPKNYLVKAFLWVSSVEGDDFWRNLNNKWLEKIK